MAKSDLKRSPNVFFEFLLECLLQVHLRQEGTEMNRPAAAFLISG